MGAVKRGMNFIEGRCKPRFTRSRHKIYLLRMRLDLQGAIAGRHNCPTIPKPAHENVLRKCRPIYARAVGGRLGTPLARLWGVMSDMQLEPLKSLRDAHAIYWGVWRNVYDYRCWSYGYRGYGPVAALCMN